MEASFVTIFILCSGIPWAISTSLMDLSVDERLKMAQDFAKTLNEKIFKTRHASYPEQGLTLKGDKAWKPDDIMNTDTIAVRIDRDGHVYVAGNVETRTTKLIGRGQFEGSEFGLNQNDHSVIRQELLQHPILRNQPLHIVETDVKATETFENRKPHAEVKLLWDRQHNPPTDLQNSNQRRMSVIAASKPACRYCSAQLGPSKIAHNYQLPKERIQQLGGGLPTVTNWQQPQDIGSVNRATYYPSYHQHFQPKFITYPGYETSKDLFGGQTPGSSYNPSHSLPDPNPKLITYPGFETTSDLFNGQIAGQKYVSNAGVLKHGRTDVLSTSPGIPGRRHSLSGPSTGLEPLPYTTREIPLRVFPASMPVKQQLTDKGRSKALITYPGDKRWTSTTLGSNPSISTQSAPTLFGINTQAYISHIATPPLPAPLPTITLGTGSVPKLSILDG